MRETILDGLSILFSAFACGITLTFVVPEKFHLSLVWIFSGTAAILTCMSCILFYRRVYHHEE
jgi:Na+-driven multidrug efflux pump